MRIISGQARGRRLHAPEGLDTRPTTDRVKESMFNLISPFLPARNVLDLYAGSGALGIEALSRYSQNCVFVESDRAAIEIVKKNLEVSRQLDKAEVVCCDALRFLSNIRINFDIIFLDPPYNQGLLTKSIEAISVCNLLSDDGIIVCETEVGGEYPSDQHFKILKQAKYGKTMVFVLANAKDTER